MADDIQSEMNALRNEFANLAATVGRFNASVSKNTTTVKDVDDMGKRAEKETFEMVTAWDKVKDAGKETIKALISFQGKLADGDTSFAALGDVVDGVSNAAGAFQSQLSKYGTLVDKNGKDTHKKVGLFGSGVSMAAGVIQKFGPASKILLAEMDKQVAAYQELSKVGATTATGITGMQEMASKSGMPFQKFVGAITANSEALAMMGGTAGQGAEKFAEMTETLTQGTDNTLRYIGMSSDQIAAASGKYIDIQAKQGMLQGRSAAQMAKDSQEYLLKMKRLSMLTGVSIDKLEDQEKEMAVDNQFQAFLTSLPPDQAEKARDLWRQFNAKGLGKEAASAMMGGITKSGQQLMNTMGTSILNFRDANLSVENIVEQSVATAERNKDQVALNQQYTDSQESAYLALTKVLAIRNVDPAKAFADVDSALDKMTTQTDQQTKDTVESQKSMEKQAVLTQKAMWKLMPGFTAGVAGVTGSMETIEDEIVNLSDKIEQITGIKVPGMAEFRDHPMAALEQTGEAVSGYVATRAGQAWDAAKDMVGLGKGATGNEATKQAMEFFQSKGWTKEQSAGIVGNLQQESGNFAADVVSGKRRGDSGKAVGIAQWHADRQQEFQRLYGKSLAGASLQEQLEFVNHELTKGSEKKAGSKIREATTAQEAAFNVDKYYERSAGTERRQRMANAAGLMGMPTTGATPAPTTVAAKSPGNRYDGYTPAQMDAEEARLNRIQTGLASNDPNAKQAARDEYDAAYGKPMMSKGLPSGMSFADASKAVMGNMPSATPVSTPVAAPNGAPSGVSVTPPVAANNPTNNTGDPNADVQGLLKQINESMKDVTIKMSSLDNKTREAGENMKKVKDSSKQAHA